MGYSISLAVSVNKLIKDKIQTVRLMYFKIRRIACSYKCKQKVQKSFDFWTFCLRINLIGK